MSRSLVTGRHEVERRAALAALAGESLGSSPVLWLFRDALDRYAAAAQRGRMDYHGCELLPGVSLLPAVALRIDDKCVVFELKNGSVSRQPPVAALELYARLWGLEASYLERGERWLLDSMDRLEAQGRPPDYDVAVAVLDRIEHAITDVSR